MSGKQKVAAVRCTGYDQALIGKKLDLLMTAIGADTLIQPGMSVLIKPNLLSAKTPEEFTTTHPEVLRAVIRYVHRHGGNVTLAVYAGFHPAGVSENRTAGAGSGRRLPAE